jgi:predicted HAD superfamily Cof-like phosphohydrolase
MVKAFHEKMGISMTTTLSSCSPNARLAEIGRIVQDLAKDIEPGVSDPVVLASHLLLEETGELVEALATCDELKALDGLTDLTYIVFGRALQFHWPLTEAFMEVHRSNMTKERAVDDAGRVRSKGPNYRPPDIESVLQAAPSPDEDNELLEVAEHALRANEKTRRYALAMLKSINKYTRRDT